MPITDAALTNWLTYHEPKNGTQAESYRKIREAALTFAQVIVAQTPESPDQSTAIRTVREAVFWANAAIACGGR
jgi:hypothetical protein